MHKKIIKRLIAALLLCCFLSCLSFGCAGKDSREVSANEEKTDTIVIGFSQVGAESDWRVASTKSMESVFGADDKFDLIIENGQQKQSNQMTAIRRFIQQEVDYIVLAPVTETGWDTVLREARDAGIPVIIVDRKVDVADDSLFTCWIGSDFDLEGEKAVEWLNAYTNEYKISPRAIHIADIQGTIGASAQIGRTKGLRNAADKYGWDLKAEVCGDFTQTKGREAMELLLSKYDDVNVVYCENDNSAFGAIEAIEAAGKKVGSDIKHGEIMIISFDGVSKQSMEYIRDDKISCLAECNPSHGARVRVAIEELEQGKTPEKYVYLDENIYASSDIVESVNTGESGYPVYVMTDELIEKREKLFEEK